MSSWLALLIGVIVGILFGIIAGRKNYEDCREQIKKLHGEIEESEEGIAETSSEVGKLEQQLEETEEKISEAEEKQEAGEEEVARAETIATEAPAAEVAPEAVEAAGAATTAEAAAASAAAAVAAEQAQSDETAEEMATRSAGGIDVGDVEVHVTECPQKLARIHGIGRVYETKLYQAGIGSYWQVATTPAEKLAEIFGLKDFQAVDLSGIQESARKLAEETNTVGLTWNGHEPDDIEDLPGIGKTYEGRLYDAGVCTWEKLAQLTPEELAAIVKAPKWNQPDYAAWIAFAKERLNA